MSPTGEPEFRFTRFFFPTGNSARADKFHLRKLTEAGAGVPQTTGD